MATGGASRTTGWRDMKCVYPHCAWQGHTGGSCEEGRLGSEGDAGGGGGHAAFRVRPAETVRWGETSWGVLERVGWGWLVGVDVSPMHTLRDTLLQRTTEGVCVGC